MTLYIKIFENETPIAAKAATAERKRVSNEMVHHIANIQLNYGELSNWMLNSILEKIRDLDKPEKNDEGSP